VRTTWVINEKIDNLSKTGSKIKARLCTMGNSAKEFSKDSVQFESPTCGQDTVKALLSLVPDNKWCIATFDVSSARRLFTKRGIRQGPGGLRLLGAKCCFAVRELVTGMTGSIVIILA